MKLSRVLFAPLVLVSLLTEACQRSLAVRETADADGFPLRIEIEAEQDAAPSSREMHERLTAHVERRKGIPKRTGLTGVPAARTPTTTTTADDFDPFVERGCPPEGSATNENQERLNRLKNRSSEPTAADIDPYVSLSALRKPGYDRERWSTGNAATIEGYVRSAKGTGPESCNCKEEDKALTDTHLDIVSAADDTRKPVIAEITPIFRLIHKHYGLEDWSSKAIRQKYEGRRVRITGWLFFDEAHLYDANNTDRYDNRGKKNWRATAWEIHPITDIQLLD
jgi:hypothetical protein